MLALGRACKARKVFMGEKGLIRVGKAVLCLRGCCCALERCGSLEMGGLGRG